MFLFVKVLISIIVDSISVCWACCWICAEYEIADISYSNELIIFTADSSKSSSITMFPYTCKLFCDQVTRFFKLPIT